MKPLKIGFPLRTTGLYGFLAGAWIVLSDRLISSLTSDPARLTFLQTYKGWGFVLVTAGLLFWLLRKEWNRLQREMLARQQAQAELHQLNLELEERIVRRTAELAEAMEKARAADHLKSAFLATMSHELRTPLNSIIGFTGILLQGLAGPLKDEQQKQMRMVQNSARHLLALINDVLDISKIEAGQLALEPGPFNLREAVEKTTRLVAPMAEKKGLDLVLEIGEGVNNLTADQRRLEQVLLNLFNNAIKFTEQGEVRISCHSDGDHYLISVSDTGIGIPPEEIGGLFQPFHQIDTGLARRHEGTGLGLSICKKLVDMMGGRIEVQSRWQQGSTFRVWIPKSNPFGENN